jgi:hypothetical protein
MADENTEDTAADENTEDTAADDAKDDVKAAGAGGDDNKDDADAGDGDPKETKVLLSDDEDDGAGGVPDEYKFTPPDELGEIEITEDVKAQLDAFSVRAKEVGLTQDQYQSLVEGEIKRGRAAITTAADGYQLRMNGWADATRSDSQLGGDNLKENLAIAKLGREALSTPALKALLDAPSKDNPEGLGLGNHPEIIRVLYQHGLTMKEDGDLVTGDKNEVAAHDASLRRMFPTMFTD